MSRGKLKILLPFLLLFLLLVAPALAQSRESATVLHVVDGDTLILKINGKEEKVRLIGIDCPEASVNPKAQKDSARTGEDLRKITKMGQWATKIFISWIGNN